MQFSRARFLSSAGTTHHGDSGVWVRSSIASLALVYSSQRRRDSRSMGLSFHCLSGSWMRLPLLERVVDAAQEADALLVVADREPVLDELDARAHQHALELGRGAEELLVLLVRAEAHHALDAGAVVPAAVEQHDLARRRQMGRIALEIPLRALAVIGRRQRGHAADARVQPLRDALDDAALAPAGTSP